MIKEDIENNKKGIIESKEKQTLDLDDPKKRRKYIDEQDNYVGKGILG